MSNTLSNSNVSTIISATGCYAPDDVITNAELVASFNAYVEDFNQQNSKDIADGKVKALEGSTAEFIEKASGIQERRTVDREGILDIARMRPRVAPRGDKELSVQAEMSVKAAQSAMQSINLPAEKIDAVIVACSNLQRAYPAVSIEVQSALGVSGFAFDMNVACSSATFAMQQAIALIKSKMVRTVLLINPEICTAHLNFRDRAAHFIFGDVATATIIQNSEDVASGVGYKILDIETQTQYSNNIRNNFGFLTPCEDPPLPENEILFKQEGRQVFRDVVPWVSGRLTAQLQKNNISADSIKRLWLHQANAKMNQLIAKQVLGREATSEECPLILDRFANTSSAGCVLAFHENQSNMHAGDLAILSSFGAGYSMGSLLLQRC